MPKKPKRSLLPVDVLLNSLFKDLGIAERIRIEAIKRQWRDIFAEPLSMHTAPSGLKEGKLIIAVDSPAWLQHLKFLQKEMIAKLKPFGIKAVQFRIGSVRSDYSRRIPERMAPPEAFRELTGDDLDRINKAVAGIDDVELKEAVRLAMEKSSRRKLGGNCF
ncbi:MAG TPA: DUF721 domain-containing protein [Dissulfurispiraceae bacterium]|nr:DUF721 domain-containing protein [Dissulfurispiraceae bacterium]